MRIQKKPHNNEHNQSSRSEIPVRAKLRLLVICPGEVTVKLLLLTHNWILVDGSCHLLHALVSWFSKTKTITFDEEQIRSSLTSSLHGQRRPFVRQVTVKK